MAKILVVGGSLGGLFVGNLLHCAGHEVHILEKVLGSLDGRGAGIVTHPSLMQYSSTSFRSLPLNRMPISCSKIAAT